MTPKIKETVEKLKEIATELKSSPDRDERVLAGLLLVVAGVATEGVLGEALDHFSLFIRSRIKNRTNH